jgi:predicted amidophosphoribosyltransferase
MKCPSCNAEVEPGSDLCLECGEPMDARPNAPKPAPPPPPPTSPGKVIVPPAGTFKSAPNPHKKWSDPEPEPLRCPGCGVKTLKPRCPSCGNRVRPDNADD